MPAPRCEGEVRQSSNRRKFTFGGGCNHPWCNDHSLDGLRAFPIPETTLSQDVVVKIAH